MDNKKASTISLLLIAEIEKTGSTKSGFNSFFGEGSYEKLVSDLYDKLNEKARAK